MHSEIWNGYYFSHCIWSRFSTLSLLAPESTKRMTIYCFCIVVPTLVFPWFFFISLILFILFIVALLWDLKSNIEEKVGEWKALRWEETWVLDLHFCSLVTYIANPLTFGSLCFIDKELDEIISKILTNFKCIYSIILT